MKLAKENYETLFKFVVLVLSDYFSFSHPHLQGAVNRIASDLIETRPTWKAADFIYLCKFLRQRQDIQDLKTYGLLTPEKFYAMVTVYEDHRAQEFETYQREKQGEIKEQERLPRTHDATDVKSLMGRMADQAAEKQEERRMKGRPDPKPAPDENWFRQTEKEISNQ